MTNKEFNTQVNNIITNKIETRKTMFMPEFLNKHAKNNNSILGYWFGDDLNGLTDVEILQKCVWLDLTKCSILETLFGFAKFEEFVEDYIAVCYTLGYEIKGGAVCKR